MPCIVMGGGGAAGMSCVPGHTGLPDYDIADVAWKPACLYGPMVSDQALGIAVRTFFHQAGLSSLQDEWTSSCYSKQQLVYMVKLCMQAWPSSFRSVRKEEVILTRLRSGHTRQTNGHLLRGNTPPMCTNSGVPLTVSYLGEMLTSWPSFHFIIMAFYLTCLQMFALAFLIFWHF